MTTKVPLYKKVKQELTDKIRSGVLSVGELMPGEEQLATEFGCSRLTVHRALRELAAEGLVERKRRAGTTVAPRDKGGILIEIPRIEQEITSRGHAYRYELLERELRCPPASVCVGMNLKKTTELLNVISRHWADDQVFQYENRWINLELAPEAADRNFAKTSANNWLLDNVPYSSVEHQISSIAATENVASYLQRPAGNPLLSVHRRTFWQKVGVTDVVMLYPGESFTLQS